MKSLICSDIHDHVTNLALALELATASNCSSVICCGDLCSPFIIDVFHEKCSLPVHVVFGNNDGDRFNMNKKATDFNSKRSTGSSITLYGEFLLKKQGEVVHGIPNEVSMAVYHYPDVARSIFTSLDYDYVFFGHSHKLSLEQDHQRLLANPGSLMGFIPGKNGGKVKPGCILYDWESRQADVIEL